MADEADDAAHAAPTKLTRTKQRWAREGRFLTGRIARPESERLPPGQHLVKDWPVLDLGQHPNIAPERWRGLMSTARSRRASAGTGRSS